MQRLVDFSKLDHKEIIFFIYFTEIFEKQQKSLEKHESNSEQVIINGDGIYLATFSAFLLNMKLSKSQYYFHPDEVKPSVSEVS